MIADFGSVTMMFAMSKVGVEALHRLEVFHICLNDFMAEKVEIEVILRK
jgi:hypothetical protein